MNNLSKNDILFISLFKDYTFTKAPDGKGWNITNTKKQTVNKNEIFEKIKQYQDAILEQLSKKEE